jgi:hypothetical protein
MPSKRKFAELEILLTLKDRTQKLMRGTIKTLGRLKKTAFDAARAISGIGALSGAGIGAATVIAGKYAVEISGIANQLNLTTDRFQEFLAVAQLKRPATEAAGLGAALKDVVERITEARSLREGDVFDSAQAIGLNLELTKSNDIIEDLIANMRELDRNKALFRLRELAGNEAYEELFTFMALTNEQVKELADTADRLGLIIEPETLENLAAMERSLGVASQIIKTMGIELAGQLAPGIENAALALAAFVSVNGGALPVLEKVWQRVTERVNDFLITLNKIPGLPDIGLIGDDDQAELARINREIRDLQSSIAQVEAQEINWFGQRNNRLRNLNELLSEFEMARDAITGVSVPAAEAFNFDGMSEEMEKIRKQLDSDLRKLGQATGRSVTKATAPNPQEVEQLKSHWLLTGKQLGEAAQTGMEAGLAGLDSLIDFELPDIDAQICADAQALGEKAANCLGESFTERMQGIQEITGAASTVLSGLEDLMSANEQKEIDRLERLRGRNAAELDILKSRLANQQGLSRNEAAMHNMRAAAVAKNNAKIDQIQAAAEAKACKRAKKFAILQGALAVASAWAGAAKTLAEVPFPANLGAYASVLGAGLSAAANVAKFNCNTIPSTSGGGAGAAGGSGGPTFNPTVRQGADLPSDSFGRRNQRVTNITLQGDNFSAEQVADLVQQINDGDSQINVDRVAGVY